MSLVARCFVSPKTGKAESEREIEKETVRQKERGRGRIKCPIGAQTHARCPKLSVSLLPATAAEASPRIEFNSQQVRLPFVFVFVVLATSVGASWPTCVLAY